MGYTVADTRTRSDREAAEYALRLLICEDEKESHKVLRFSVSNDVIGCGYTFVTYAAVESIFKETGVRKVWCMTVLQHRTASEVGWKFVDEFMGPNNTKCPPMILDLLTETDSAYALDFRKCSRLFTEGLPKQAPTWTMKAA